MESNMKIEFVEFYPTEIKSKHIAGSLRIKLVDKGIDLLGIYCIRKAKKTLIRMPFRMGYDFEEKKPNLFPFVSFEDKDYFKELIKFLIDNAGEFIDKRCRDTVNPPKLLTKEHQEIINEFRRKKKFAPSQKSTVKAFIDPPPKKWERKPMSKFTDKSRAFR